MATGGNQLSYSKCIAEIEPIAMAMFPSFIATKCNVCFRKMIPPATMKLCTSCRFAHYCSRECQVKAWTAEHKGECKLLAGKLKRWQEWDSKYLVCEEYPQYGEKFRAKSLLFFRLMLKRDSGTLSNARGSRSGRTFADLISDVEEEKLAFIEDEKFRKVKYYEMFDVQLCASFLYEKPIDDDTIIEYCEKVAMNGQSTASTCPKTGELVGVCQSLFLDYSANSGQTCWPKVQLMSAAGRMRIVPLPDADGRPLLDANTSNIAQSLEAAYLLSTKGARRTRIERRYHLACECERCSDPADDFLSAIACEKCQTAIPVDDSSFRHCDRAHFSDDVPLSAAVLKQIQRTIPLRVIDIRATIIITKQEASAPLKSPEKPYQCQYFGSAYKTLRLVCPSCTTQLAPERIELALAMMSTIEAVTHQMKCTRKRERIGTLSPFDAACAKVLPDCNLYRAKLHRLMADAEGAEPAERARRLEKWFAVLQKCLPRGNSLRNTELDSLCLALLNAGKFDELRPMLAERLQAEKIYYCFALQLEEVKEFFVALAARLGLASYEVDFCAAFLSLSPRDLLELANKLYHLKELIQRSWQS